LFISKYTSFRKKWNTG